MRDPFSNKFRFVAENTAIMTAVLTLFRLLFDNTFNIAYLVSDIVTGVVTSLAFLVFFPRLMKRAGEKLARTIPVVQLDENEDVLLTSGASHFRGWEAVGGMLTLTNLRLVFRSHKFNLQRHETVIALTDIQSAELDSHRSGKVFQLQLTNNERRRFVVHSPADWVKGLSGTK